MSDITKVAVYDARVVQESPVAYAVEKGGVSISSAPFAAISQTSSQHNFQIQCPSESVFIDKCVLWTSNCYLGFTATRAAAATVDAPVCSWGVDFSLASFPLHRLVQTASATINDTTVTTNTADTINEILRLSIEAKNRQQRTCPTFLDTYQNYNDAVGAASNPLAGYNNALNSENVPNGAYYNVTFTDYLGNTLPNSSTVVTYATSSSTTGNQRYGVPVQTAGTGNSYKVFISFQTTEKLMISPFIWQDSREYETGMFGIQNISVSLNMLSPSFTGLNGRPIRTQSTNVAFTALAYQATPFSNSSLNVTFISPSLSLPLPLKSIVPYMEFPRYIQNVSTSFSVNALTGLNTTSFSSNTITLPQIPDYLIIYMKPTTYNATEADYYLPITQISLNWNNYSGLMSTYTTPQLFNISADNFLEQDYNQWIGFGTTTAASGAAASSPYKPLVGGPLVIKPSRDYALQVGEAPSLVGNFTLSFSGNVINQTSNNITSANLWVIAINSGFFESVKGQSRIIKGVLDEKSIIETSQTTTRSDVTRYVGGGFLKSFSNIASKALPMIQQALPLIQQYAPVAQDLMKNFGFGRRRQVTMPKMPKNLSARLM